MDNKEIILKIYKAILNDEVEIENLNIMFTEGMVLHITGKENTDFKDYIDKLSKKLHYEYVNYRQENYYKNTELPLIFRIFPPPSLNSGSVGTFPCPPG